MPASWDRRYAIAVAVVGAVGLWVLWPVLWGGLITDDFIEAAMIDGTFAAPRHPLDLFVFTTGEPADVAALQRLGSMPWWTSDALRLSFMRPLASAMVHVDRLLFGRDLVGYHAHSLVWWVLLVLSAAHFYRRLLPPAVAIVAVALFALNDSHHYAVLWLANRGGIIALCLGILGLRSLFQHQLAPSRARATVALSLFSLSLAAGEWVFPLFAYALSHTLWLGRGRWARRLWRLWPMILPAVGFLALRALLGYGANASGVYVDPVGEPGRFLRALATRAPLLVADVVLDLPAHYWDVGSPLRDTILRWGVFSPEVWARLPGWRFWHVVLGYVAIATAVALCWLVIRRSPEARRPTLAFLACGAALSLVPVVASFPSSRLVLPAWLGGAACAAELAVLLARDLARAHLLSLRAFMARYLLLVLGFNNLLWSPVHAPVKAMVAQQEAVVEWCLSADIPREGLRDRRLFILNGGEFTSTFFLPYVRAYYGEPLPASSYPLTFARHPVDVLRVSERSIAVHIISGSFLSTDAEVFFRKPSEVMPVGTRIRLPEMTVEVTRTRGVLPIEILFTFDRPLEDPGYLFLASRPLGLERLKLPAPGEWLRLPRPVPPNWYGAQRGAWQRRVGPLPDFLDYDWAPEFLDYRTPRQRYEHEQAKKRKRADRRQPPTPTP